MRIFASLTIGSLLLALSMGFAQEKKVKNVPATYTNPTSGTEMYTTYCAVCHGQDGKGSGPAASALKAAPSDLTQLSRKNSGKFPASRIKQYIEGADTVAAHGSRDMPIWGNVFRQMGTNLSELRVANLSKYIEDMQQK
jgi:mono/diheme cytochrome c family protein